MTQDEIQMPEYLNAAYEGDDLYTGDQVRELMKLVAAKEREAIADELEHGYIDDYGHHIQYAAAIRARSGNTE